MRIDYSEVKVAVPCYSGHFIHVVGNLFFIFARSHSNLDLWKNH